MAVIVVIMVVIVPMVFVVKEQNINVEIIVAQLVRFVVMVFVVLLDTYAGIISVIYHNRP